jgi:putative OPT family oligopeptide transporter
MNIPLVKHVEITARGIILGVLITLIFTAAQVYLGLKVGLTFATSIPAAVISMALLRFFKSASVQENNIVQTIASAAGTLSSVIFVLPGLIIIGWWQKVPFWETFAACAIGGVLGVMYTMPLRRALVTNSDLPYPEGVAAAEVLKIGTSSREGAAEGEAGLWALILSSVGSALFALAAAVGILAQEVSKYIPIGRKGGATGIGGSSSLALIGAGHLMGITVGIAFAVGLTIAWGGFVPYLTHLDPTAGGADVQAHATFIWKNQVRFIGAGTIGAAAVWTLGKLALPVWSGLVSALEADRARKGGGVVPRSEQDLPVWIVGLVTVLSAVPAGWLLAHFLGGTPLASLSMPLVAAGVVYIILAGLLAAAVCGYMAGLIGSSNSPVSGIAILSVLGAAVIIGVIGRAVTGPDGHQALVAFALMVTTVVLAVAVIGNDNLQDLKTGQLVDATPWKQQFGLIIGVFAGAVVVPVILNILNNVWGFPGDPHYHALDVKSGPLNAPQATLISTLAAGAIGGKLPLDWLGMGVMVGAVLVVIDEILRRATKGKYALPPLGVGLAMYLPSSVTSPVVLGAVGGWLFEKMVGHMKNAEVAKRLGVLVASGFIVGESLLNVGLAIVYSSTGDPAIFSKLITPPPERVAMMAALIIAIAVVVGLYMWSAGQARKIEEEVK